MSKARKYAIKILTKYINMEMCFNKTILKIELTSKIHEKLFFYKTKQKFIYLFIYKTINLCIAMKLCINHLEYLKYLYKKIEILKLSFKIF